MKTSEPVLIDKDKLSEIIEFASKEIASKSEGVSNDTIASHIVTKMKEVLKDDN